MAYTVKKLRITNYELRRRRVMIGLVWLGLLVVLTLVAAEIVRADGPVVVDHDDVALFDEIPAEYLAAAQGMSMFYSDRSVGANLNEGLNCLASHYDTALHSCRVWRHVNPAYTVAPEVWGGTYPRPLWAYRDGASATATVNWWYWTPAAVWGYFPSYLEAPNLAGKVDATFQQILNVGGDSQRIAWTSSLARVSDMRAAQANAEIREWAAVHGLPLLDAADILSHRPDGTPCYDNRDGVLYVGAARSENYPDDGVNAPAICQEYTTEVEGGHLGSVATGKIRLAKAVWVLMAQLAGWQPAAQPTATPEPTWTPWTEWTATPTATPEPTATPAGVCVGRSIEWSNSIQTPDGRTIWYTTLTSVVSPAMAGVQITAQIDGRVLTCTTRAYGNCTLQYRWPELPGPGFVLTAPGECGIEN